MFRAFSRPSSGAQWLQWQPLGLPSYRGDSRAVFVVGPAGQAARPRKKHDYHHDTNVKPEAATAVIELLMMGGKTPETCWTVNIRQDNKLENCWMWLVIYLKCHKISTAFVKLTAFVGRVTNKNQKKFLAKCRVKIPDTTLLFTPVPCECLKIRVWQHRKGSCARVQRRPCPKFKQHP
jgi:hypothetical protein